MRRIFVDLLRRISRLYILFGIVLFLHFHDKYLAAIESGASFLWLSEQPGIPSDAAGNLVPGTTWDADEGTQ
jgi:hypothetical protein